MRFQAHDNVDNRKLLWHGTNVAVVAAILKGGLRIMPHSGGRVGSGIYFASENGKSAAYGKAIPLMCQLHLNPISEHLLRCYSFKMRKFSLQQTKCLCIMNL